MAREPFTIRKFKGLDNRNPVETLATFGTRSESKLGETFLPTIINADIDSDFGVTRRRGWQLQSSGLFHSLWTSPDRSLTFVVKDGQVGVLDTDLVFTGLLPAAEDFFSYADTGAGVYFSDGHLMAVYVDGVATVLSRAGTYDPTSRVVDPAEDGVVYDATPAGSIIVWAFGRLWVVTDLGIFYSRGYHPDQFNLADDYLNLPDVTMLAATATGYYIGTSEAVYYVSGANPKMPSLTKPVCDFGAFPRSAAVLPASQFGGANDNKDDVVVWESPRGKVLGKNEGAVELMTNEHVSYPSYAEYAATFLREVDGEVHHVASLAQPSTDGSNMRATDTAVAEIRRNGVIIQ